MRCPADRIARIDELTRQAEVYRRHIKHAQNPEVQRICEDELDQILSHIFAHLRALRRDRYLSAIVFLLRRTAERRGAFVFEVLKAAVGK